MNDFMLSPQGPQTVLFACSDEAKAWMVANIPSEGLKATYSGLFIATELVDPIVSAISDAGMQVVPVTH